MKTKQEIIDRIEGYTGIYADWHKLKRNQLAQLLECLDRQVAEEFFGNESFIQEHDSHATF